MPEEIKYIDENEISEIDSPNESKEIKPIEETKEITKNENNSNQKIIIPNWNIEPPFEIQRGI